MAITQTPALLVLRAACTVCEGLPLEHQAKAGLLEARG